MTEKRSLWIAVVTFALGVLALERCFAWYGPNHFIPEARLKHALSRPAGCIVFAGDSRMVAGYDEAALTGALRAHGRDRCVATIAIGALKTSGIAVAVREYVARGGRPSVVVVGASEDTLLARSTLPDPAEFLGNESVLLAWSEPSDVLRHVPGFPLESPRAFDRGFRFLVARSSGLGPYLSFAWQKIQSAQDRLTGHGGASNIFGALSDMEANGRAMERRAHEELGVALGRSESERFDPWFFDLEKRVHTAGARLVVVELPMPAYYRTGVTRSETGKHYLQWIEAYLQTRGHGFIDLTESAAPTAEHFADFIHLNEEGARRFSTQLGDELGRMAQ